MPQTMHVTAIIAAGGRGQRLGTSVPKQLLEVGGRPILERSVSLFLDHPQIQELVIALPSDVAANPPEYLRKASKPIRIVEGGARRQDSVARAFVAVSPASDIVVVHDAARPFASAALVTRTILAAAEAGAAVAAMPARDTVKRGTWRSQAAAASGTPTHQAALLVTETLPRETIFLAQTPQAFRRDVLREALKFSSPDVDATDEALLAERAGFSVRLVEGEASNMKVTTPDDLVTADRLAWTGTQRITRAGTGYDLHRLAAGRPLMLGGVRVPSDAGPIAHSDGDVICHALIDAMLGAAGLGDIGRHFPDTDLQWKDAAGLDLLRRAHALVIAAGYQIVNLDATVILEKPKIKDHIEAMRAAVAGASNIDRGQVSIKGKTNEGVDAIGRGEAIAAHAIAVLQFIGNAGHGDR